MSAPGTSRTNLNRAVAVGVTVALLIPLVVLAIRADGFHATKVNLNDAGIWVVNWNSSLAGRINTQTGSIEVVVPSPKRSFDLAQADEVVVLNVAEDRVMMPVDVALARLGEPIDLAEGGAAILGGSVGAVSDPAAGKVWATGRGQLTQLDMAATAPLLEAGAGAVTVVGVDGTTYAYAPGATEIHVARPGADPVTVAVPPVAADPQLTAVGDHVVVLDPAEARLVVPDRPPVDLSGRGGGLVLQQPGPGRDEVLVATDESLLSVRLDDGSVREVAGGGTRAAVAPVWLDGCAFGAWTASPRYVQACDGADLLADVVPGVQPGGEMAFRVNRNRVVLNDSSTGLNLLFTDDKPLEVNDWQDALNKDRHNDQVTDEVVERPPTACGDDTSAAELADDRAGTRPGRPVIVAVLDNDLFPRCEVPVVSIPSPPDPAVATVAVVRGGTAIQVTPAADRTASFSIEYEVALAMGRPRALLTVDVAAGEQNEAPITQSDHTSVVAGRSVRHDVLANDRDPEGDPMTLVRATVADSGTGGSVSFRADGAVSFTASGGTSGVVPVSYVVEDDRGATAEGTLEVTVAPEDTNSSPSAQSDRVVAIVGREESVALLANDSDPNGDPLQIVSVSQPPDLDVSWDDKGELRVRPARAGTWTFGYSISDGAATADAQVRVDASEPVANRPPVAVRDDVAVRPGVPAYVDLLANDFDPDGDLLAVVAVDVPTDPPLTVELLDKHVARVTAPAGFDEVVRVAYTVSDGTSTAGGALLVRPFRDDGVDQPPIVGADDVTIRAGNIAGIAVLENDLDPEGERLTLTRVGVLAEGEGQIFVESDQLRFAAPPVGPATVRVSYTVEDPAGNRADGAVTIRVLPVDNPNQPPRGPRLEARVYDGEETAIVVPVIGADPDGDQVFVVGVTDPPPRMGHAVPIPVGFSYRADRGASGTDTFSFVVRDALGAEATGTVRVSIVARPATNSNPVAVPDRKSAKAGASTRIAVLANDNDPDGDELALLVDGKDAPTHPRVGAVRVDPEGSGLVFDAPADAAAGEVSFSYGITDGRGGSARGIVTVTVEVGDVANKAPIARDDLAPLQNPGSSVIVDVLANDIDPDGEDLPLQVAIVTPGVDASVTPEGAIRVTVQDRSLALVYEVTDAGGATARAVVSVPVLEQRPPNCETRTIDVAAGETERVPVLDSCHAASGGDLELVRVLAERGGTVRLEGSEVVFTAAAQVLGDGGFSYAVRSGTTIGYGGVIVRVSGQDFVPSFARTTVDLPAGGSRSLDLSSLVSDLNAEDTHTFTDLRGATDQVQATLEGSRLRVVAGDTSKGATATLVVQVSDGTNTIDGQIDVRVLAHDGQPPAAVDDTGETSQTEPVSIDVTANDIDPLGRGLTVRVLAQTGGSAATEGDRSIRFTPSADFVGEATVTYEISDATADPERRSSATARIRVIGFPSAPTAPAGVRESKLIRLTWGAASPNGAPVTEYVVESNRGETRTSPSNALVFDGLTNATSYQFRVAARNVAVKNDSQLVWSGWSGPLTPDEVPGAPGAPRLTFANAAIRVAWTAPVVDGSAITGYRVRISGRSTNETREVGLVTQMDWNGLVNGESYVFAVSAANEAGWGEFGLNSNDPVNSVPATVPGPVQRVVGTRLDTDTTAGGLVDVTWQEPIANGNAEFNFVVSVDPADVAPRRITDASVRHLEIGGLQNGRAYTFSVTASNKAGTGPPGTSSPTIPAARPDPVADLGAVPGNNTATLSWSNGRDNGAAVDSWQYSANGGAWAPMTPDNGPAGANSGDSVVAPNDVAATMRVRACNVVGCSDPSAPSGQVIPFGPPVIHIQYLEEAYINWWWDRQPGVTTYTVIDEGRSIGGTPGAPLAAYSRYYGGQPGRTVSITLVAEGQGVTQQSVGSVFVPDTRRVTISWGRSAAGQTTDRGTPCNPNCRYLDLRIDGFVQNTDVAVTCRSDYPGDADGFQDRTYNPRDEHGLSASDVCFFGWPDTDVWITVDGIASNRLRLGT